MNNNRNKQWSLKNVKGCVKIPEDLESSIQVSRIQVSSIQVVKTLTIESVYACKRIYINQKRTNILTRGLWKKAK